ncbi:RHS repeat-associated core domain-containing protein [Streptomyces sp. NPDC021562]|uniref:RHS repeat-associated core domain-containing protein n=1 Tax=Streptomyces sp. NPDC021562 TaxID=3155121 RepID=UPI0033D32D99
MAGYRPADWHPLDLDKDPTPGDPQRVRTLAAQLHTFADDVSDALRLVKGMAGEDALLQWAGKSAKVFKEQFKDVPKNLKKLKQSYELCGDALADYWPKLERAQALADKALAKAKEAQADLSSAKSRLSSADSWVTRATKEADKYKDDPTGSKSDGDKPDEGKVRAATRDVQSAKSAHSKAQSDVTSAQSALDAAKKMAEDARKMRDDAAGEAKRKIDAASDAGIPNRHWWQDVGHWFEDNWDTIVTVCKVVVAVVGIIALIIGGPILGAIVLVAALVVLADTLYKYSKGQASLWDVAFAAMDCIPGGKGITSLGKLAKGMRGLGKLGLKGMAKAARGNMGKLRREAQLMAERRCKSDPVDVVTGDVVASVVDVELLGTRPLVFERHHVSSFRDGQWFGPSWSSVLDERVLLDADGVRLVTADGMVLHYPTPEAGLPMLPVMGPRWPLGWSGAPGSEIDGMCLLVPDTGQTRHFRALPGLTTSELRLIRISDRDGSRVDVEYDTDGVPRAVLREGGYRLGLETADRRVTALRLDSAPGRPVIARYRYDEAGNLSETYDSSERALRLSYDAEHRITTWRDRNDTDYQYVYDEEGRCIRTIGSDGFHSGTFQYDVDRHTTVYVDSLGCATVYRYDRDFRVTEETNPLGHTTTTEWDDNNRVLAETDALGRTTRYAYTLDGNLRTVVRPDGLEATAEYNELRLPVRVTEVDASEWRFEYDERGCLLAVTDPAGATTRHVYDRTGRMVAVSDGLGQTRHFRYDDHGRVDAVTDALGAVTRFTYDSFGRVVAMTDARGAETRYGWTPEGRMTWRVTPGGATERWSYDDEGNETEHHDPVGGVTRSEYTHFGVITARTGPDGSRLLFRHDTERRLTSVTDAAGRTWSYTYDAVGNTTKEEDFSGRVLTYAYDAANQLVSRTDALGRSTHYGRDLLGNLVEQRTPDGVTTFAYDALGRVVRAENSAALVTLERDALGRIVRETCNGRTLHSTYDAIGRRVQRCTPNGLRSTWEYDADNRPVALHMAGRSMTLGYDRTGRETGRRLGPVELTRRWDGDDRLVAQSVSGVPERSALLRGYSYRADHHPVGVADSVSGSRRFELDSVGRVISVTADSWTEGYAYDPAGDVTHASWTGTVTQPAEAEETAGRRSYGPLGTRQAGRTFFEHDAQGRMVRRTRRLLSGGSHEWRYGWNNEDRLVEVVTPDGRRWRYAYDAFGRRVAKRLLAEDGAELSSTDFIWDGNELAEQCGGDGDQVLSWEWSPHTGEPVAQAVSQATPSTPQADIDARFYAIVTDLVGTPTELIDDTGETGWRLRTTLWGLPLADPGIGTSCPFRFPGQYHDDETGLHYNYHRYYDPALGRYLSLDPIGLGGGPNPGWYVPNPMVWIDPFGLALCRTTPRLETGDLKKGWIHIESRHITGTNPSTRHADMMPPTTTREQVHAAAKTIVKRGTRISDPAKRIQTFEKRMTVNGHSARYSVTVDSHDGNNIITFFPMGKSAV